MGKRPGDLTPGGADPVWGADPPAPPRPEPARFGPAPMENEGGRPPGEADPVVRLVYAPHESEDLERDSEADLRANTEADLGTGIERAVRADDDDNNSDDKPDVPEIRDEIEQTRAEMSETINAIQERLSPQHLAEEAREAVRGATLGKAEQMVSDIQDTARNAGSGLFDTIRENPIPAALAGIGLTWLFMGRRSRTPTWSGHNGYPDYVETRYGPTTHGRAFYGPQGPGYGPPEYRPQSSSGSERGLGTKAGEMAGQAKDTAGRVIDTAGEKAGDATERAAELAMGAGERAVDVATTMGSTSRDAGGTLWANIRANPIPAAIAGVGLAWLVKGWDNSAAERSSYGTYDYSYGARRHADNPAGEMIMRADPAERGVLSQADQIKNDALSQADQFRHEATGKAQGLFEESPLVLGALAFGLGAAAGLAVPSTRREGELMGEARDTLMERTASVLQDTQERVRSVAEEAQRTLQEEMRPEQSRQSPAMQSSGTPSQPGSTTSSLGTSGQSQSR